MDLLATLRRSGGIDALARQIGLPPTTVAAAVEALLPALIGGLRDYAQRLGEGDAGVQAMLAMIDGFGDGNLAAEVMGPGPLTADSGDKIVALFFDSANAKRWLAAEVAAETGQDALMLERIVSPLAMLVCGYITARVGADGAHDDSIDWVRALLKLPKGGAAQAGSGTHG
jgi:hypothetical protein